MFYCAISILPEGTGQNKIGCKKFGIALVLFGALRAKPDCTLEPALWDSLNLKEQELFLQIGVQAFFPDPVQTLEKKSQRTPGKSANPSFCASEFPSCQWHIKLVNNSPEPLTNSHQNHSFDIVLFLC